jgi:hypothetical protein
MERHEATRDEATRCGVAARWDNTVLGRCGWTSRDVRTGMLLRDAGAAMGTVDGRTSPHHQPRAGPGDLLRVERPKNKVYI